MKNWFSLNVKASYIKLIEISFCGPGNIFVTIRIIPVRPAYVNSPLDATDCDWLLFKRALQRCFAAIRKTKTLK